MIDDTQLRWNQEAIDLMYECLADEDFCDPKQLLKYLRNNGFEIHKVGDGHKDYQ